MIIAGNQTITSKGVGVYKVDSSIFMHLDMGGTSTLTAPKYVLV